MLAVDLLVAFALDFVLGDPEWFPHPVRAIGYMVSRVESFLRGKLSRVCRQNHSRHRDGAPTRGFPRIFVGAPPPWRGQMRTISPEPDSGNRPSRDPEFFAGTATVLIVVFSTAFFVWGTLRVAGVLGFWAERVVSVLWLYFGLSSRCLAREAIQIYRKLIISDLLAARTLLARIVGRDTNSLDEAGISRAAIESVAENTVDGIISPLFYAVFGGPVLMWIFKAVSTCDSMIGHRNVRYERFGRFGARLDDVANYLPARLGFILFPLASAILRLSWVGTWRTAWRDRRKHASPNAGIPEAAMAGALGVRLGGLVIYDGEQVEYGPFGAEFPIAESRHIVRAVDIMWAVTLLTLLVAVLLSCA